MDERGCWGKAELKVDRQDLLRLQAALELTGTHSITAPSGTLRRPCSRSTLKCSRMSPSIASLTRKPNPRVASNHFTRPVTAGSSASGGSFFNSTMGRTSPSARLRTRLPWDPINTTVSVGKPTFAKDFPVSSRDRSQSSFISTSAPAGLSAITLARPKDGRPDHRSDRFFTLFRIASWRSRMARFCAARQSGSPHERPALLHVRALPRRPRRRRLPSELVFEAALAVPRLLSACDLASA